MPRHKSQARRMAQAVLSLVSLACILVACLSALVLGHAHDQALGLLVMIPAFIGCCVGFFGALISWLVATELGR